MIYKNLGLGSKWTTSSLWRTFENKCSTCLKRNTMQNFIQKRMGRTAAKHRACLSSACFFLSFFTCPSFRKNQANHHIKYHKSPNPPWLNITFGQSFSVFHLANLKTCPFCWRKKTPRSPVHREENSARNWNDNTRNASEEHDYLDKPGSFFLGPNGNSKAWRCCKQNKLRH